LPFTKKEPKLEKIQAVAELKEVLDASTVILTEYQGLDLKNTSALRKKLRESGGGYRVVKNTLFTLAAAGMAAEPLAEGLKGPTAIVYTDSDPVAAAKALQECAKASKTFKVKSGMVDGQLFSAAQIDTLAKIPPRQELYAMVVGGLQSPITGLVGTLQSMMSQLVMTLQGVADKKAAA